MVVAEFASAAALATFSKTVAQSAISEAELEKMILQADRLADLLRKRLSYLKAGDATISAPSPFSLLPSIDELCLVIDHISMITPTRCAPRWCARHSIRPCSVASPKVRNFGSGMGSADHDI